MIGDVIKHAGISAYAVIVNNNPYEVIYSDFLLPMTFILDIDDSVRLITDIFRQD